MLPRADAHRLDGPLWARWALVEAFAAGRASVAAEAETPWDRIGDAT
jgi:hypothetical protein